MEGTEEVKGNQYDLLISRYGLLNLPPGKFISQIYKRFILLLNELTLHGRIYPQKGD